MLKKVMDEEGQLGIQTALFHSYENWQDTVQNEHL